MISKHEAARGRIRGRRISVGSPEGRAAAVAGMYANAVETSGISARSVVAPLLSGG